MNPKALILRRVVLAIGLFALCFAWPELALGFFPLIANPCCCGTNCDACLAAPDDATAQYQITFTGVTEVSCGTCVADYNATFTVDNVISTGTPCTWTHAVSLCAGTGPSLTVDSINMSLTLDAGPTAHLIVTFANGATDHIQWKANFGGKVGCRFAAQGVGFFSHTAGANGCNWNSSSAVVTAV